MKNIKNCLKQNWFNILAVIVLLVAITDQPYSYYQFLRWAIMLIGAYTAYIAYNNKQNNWAWAFGIIAILFNPIFPFYMQKSTWQLIDLITAVVFSVKIFKKE